MIDVRSRRLIDRIRAAVEALAGSGGRPAGTADGDRSTGSSGVADPVDLVSRALTLAARTGNAEGAQRLLRMYAELYGEPLVDGAGDDHEAQLASMERRFAKDLRDGVFDGACSWGARAVLLERIRFQLGEAAPVDPVPATAALEQ